VGYPIGVDMQQTQNPDGTTTTTTTPNGQMTAPQDQTGSSPVPLNVYAMPNQALTCSVTPATDWDHWAMTGINWPTDSGYVADSVTSYAWSCSGGAITTSNGATVWTAPSAAGTYTITCTMDDMPAAVVAPDCGTRDDQAVARSVTVIVPSISMGVRRNGATVADPNNPGGTMAAPFSSSATVAAGNVQTAEHEGDVQFTATNADGTPAAGVPLALTGVIVSGGQGPTDPPGNVDATFAIPALTTDSHGQAVAPGAFLSGSRTENTVVQAQFQNGQGPQATFTQVWNELSDSDAWSYDPYFEYDLASTISYTMQFEDGGSAVPITSHAAHMVTEAVGGYEWTPTDDEGDGDYEPEYYGGNDLITNGYGQLVSYSAVTAVGDVYSSDMKVPSDYFSTTKLQIDMIAYDVTFDFTDDDTYDAN
jgi:hypothetical protein